MRRNGKYFRKRISAWDLVAFNTQYVNLNLSDADGTATACPVDGVPNGQVLAFEWEDGSLLVLTVDSTTNPHVSSNGLRCVLTATPLLSEGDPGTVPGGDVTVAFEPTID